MAVRVQLNVLDLSTTLQTMLPYVDVGEHSALKKSRHNGTNWTGSNSRRKHGRCRVLNSGIIVIHIPETVVLMRHRAVSEEADERINLLHGKKLDFGVVPGNGENAPEISRNISNIIPSEAEHQFD